MKTKEIPHGKPLEYHIPCPHCGSSDAVTKFQHPKGHSYYKCFSGNCGRIWDEDKDSTVIDFTEQKAYRESMNTSSAVQMPNDYAPGDNHWGRGLTEETFNAFGVTCSEDGSILFFPHYDYNGNLTGYKQKTQDKKFYWHGDARRSGLFGNKLFKDGTSRRAVTVTEGQEDAMAVYQMFGSKYAAVSIVAGAESAKNLSQEDIKFLSSFEEVVICFDNDEPGRKGAKALARSFGTGVKVSILDLSLKDANEYLKAGREEEFRKAWFNNKKPYRPDELVYSSETKDLVDEGNPKPIASYPFHGMNDMAWGIFSPSVIVLTAGTSSGKSAFLKKFLLHLFNTTDFKFGCIFLEESVKKTLYKFIAQDIGINIGNPSVYDETDKGVIKKSWEKLFSKDRFMFMRHFGSLAIDIVCDQVRYLANSFGAKVIALDHISIVVSSQENGDERKAIDAVMTKLRSVAEELDIVIFIVSHLKRPNGTDSHEEGGQTSLAQLRGSGSIAQLADTAWGLERNGQHEDEFFRNVTTIRSLKQRESGQTGPSAMVLWNNDTCTFTELDRDDIDNHVQHLKQERERKKTEQEPTPTEI